MNILKFKRNEPCSCGSNKKYKNCCWNPCDLAALRIKQYEEYKIKKEKEEKERAARKAELEKLFPSNSFEFKNTNNPAPRRRINSLMMLSLALAASSDLRGGFLR